MNKRVIELQSKLGKIDVAVICNFFLNNNYNYRYFSKSNAPGVLAIPRNGEGFIIVNKAESESAKKRGLRVYKIDRNKRLFQRLKEILSKKKIKHKKIGVDKENFNLLIYEKLKKTLKGRYADISEMCKEIRSIKDEEEIRNIKKACKITDDIFKKIIKKFNFKTEKGIKEFIDNEIKKEGCEPAFPTVVASGKNAYYIHHEPDSKLKKGFLVLDFGAKYREYPADMTRTIYLGKPKEKDLEIYNLVLRVQKECLNEIKKNRKCGELHDFAMNALGKNAKMMSHSLGHGIGLEIHESPRIGTESKEKIRDGMAFTIEPGIYFENRLGIRIEDTILLKNGKINVLTKSRKELIAIKG